MAASRRHIVEKGFRCKPRGGIFVGWRAIWAAARGGRGVRKKRLVKKPAPVKLPTTTNKRALAADTWFARATGLNVIDPGFGDRPVYVGAPADGTRAATEAARPEIGRADVAGAGGQGTRDEEHAAARAAGEGASTAADPAERRGRKRRHRVATRQEEPTEISRLGCGRRQRRRHPGNVRKVARLPGRKVEGAEMAGAPGSAAGRRERLAGRLRAPAGSRPPGARAPGRRPRGLIGKTGPGPPPPGSARRGASPALRRPRSRDQQLPASRRAADPAGPVPGRRRVLAHREARRGAGRKRPPFRRRHEARHRGAQGVRRQARRAARSPAAG